MHNMSDATKGESIDIYNECNLDVVNKKKRKQYVESFYNLIQGRFVENKDEKISKYNKQVIDLLLNSVSMPFGLDRVFRFQSQDLDTLDEIAFLLFRVKRSFNSITLNDDEFILLCKFASVIKNIDATNINSFFDAFYGSFKENEFFILVNPRTFTELFFVKNFNQNILLAMLYFRKFPVILNYNCEIEQLTGNPYATDEFYDRNILFPSEYPTEQQVRLGRPDVDGSGSPFAYLPAEYLEIEKMPMLRRSDVDGYKV